MRHVVTGSAGFIGQHLVRALEEQGHEVYGQDFVNGDDISKDHQNYSGIDTVFHLAAISSLPECQADPARAFEVNVVGTTRVLEAARNAGVRRVVFASTSAVYENTVSRGFLEDDHTSPDLVYSQTKLVAENLCLSYIMNYGMDIVILRYFNVYGPGQNQHRPNPPMTAYIVRELLAGRSSTLCSPGTQERDYVYVHDVVEATMLAGTEEGARGQVLNICSGQSSSVRQIYSVAQGVLNTNIQAIWQDEKYLWNSYPQLYETPFPLNSARVGVEAMKYSRGNPAKTYDILGWHASTSMVAGLRAMVAAALKGGS